MRRPQDKLKDIDYKIECLNKYERFTTDYERRLGDLILRRQKTMEEL